MNIMNAQAIVDNLRALGKRTDADGSCVIDEALKFIDELNKQNKHFLWLARRPYARRSEKVPPGQLALDLIAQLVPSPSENAGNEESEQARPSGEDHDEKKPAKDAKEKRPRRKTRIDLLPVEVREVKPDPSELKCESHEATKRQINIRVQRQVVYEPAKLYVLEERIYEYQCDLCDEEPVSCEGTPTLVEGGLASASLLSHIVVAKTIDATPIERVARQLERHGAYFATARLYDAWAIAADEVGPLRQEALRRLVRCAIISLDDSPFYFKVPDRDGLQRGRVWLYIGDRGQVAFCQFTEDWKGHHPCGILDGYGGIIQNDGYGGIDSLFTKEGGPLRAGCSDHSRRRFVVALEQGDDRAAPIIDLFKVLYAIERRARRDGLGPDDLLDVRQKKSILIWEQIDEQVRALNGHVHRKCPLGKAVTYWINQRDALKLFLSDGRIPISNIHVEQLLRSVALCRKTSLYTGSLKAGERYAKLLTLAFNCTLHGVNPYLYFRDTFDHLAKGWPARLVGDLLPQAYSPADGFNQ